MEIKVYCKHILSLECSQALLERASRFTNHNIKRRKNLPVSLRQIPLDIIVINIKNNKLHSSMSKKSSLGMLTLEALAAGN